MLSIKKIKSILRDLIIDEKESVSLKIILDAGNPKYYVSRILEALSKDNKLLNLDLIVTLLIVTIILKNDKKVNKSNINKTIGDIQMVLCGDVSYNLKISIAEKMNNRDYYISRAKEHLHYYQITENNIELYAALRLLATYINYATTNN